MEPFTPIENFLSTKEFVTQSFSFLKQQMALIKNSPSNAVDYQQSLIDLIPALVNEVSFSATQPELPTNTNSTV